MTHESIIAWHSFVTVTHEASQRVGHPNEIDAAWCYWVQRASENFIFVRENRTYFEQAWSALER
jgi:hypothetical protein